METTRCYTASVKANISVGELTAQILIGGVK
jgi:hypothetical protein